jgi:hypothetical protein
MPATEVCLDEQESETKLAFIPAHRSELGADAVIDLHPGGLKRQNSIVIGLAQVARNAHP